MKLNFGMFKKDDDRTPREKSSKAKLGILARLLGCAYLIYIAVGLLKMTIKGQTGGINKTLTYVIAGVIIVGGAIMILITVIEFLRKASTGAYSAENYYKQEFGENFTAEDIAEYEAKIAEEREQTKRRGNSKDSFADREELDRLLYLEHLKKEQEDKANGEAVEEEPEEFEDNDSFDDGEE